MLNCALFDRMIPRHAGARGDDGNSLEGRTGGGGREQVALSGLKTGSIF
jgi:hypothetical protein